MTGKQLLNKRPLWRLPTDRKEAPQGATPRAERAMELLEPLAEASDKRLLVDLDAEGWAPLS